MVRPILPAAVEAEAIWELMRLRLMVSVCMAAEQSAAAPDNAYLNISQEQAFVALAAMSQIHPHFAADGLRQACG